MAKIIIEIKDKKDNKNETSVEMKMQGYDKASDTEKNTTAMVWNVVDKSLKDLKDKVVNY